MMRDELLKRISALPQEAEIGVKVGDGHLDITDVLPWGNDNFVALICHSADLRDLLAEWGLPANLRRRVVPGDRVPTKTGYDGQTTVSAMR